MRGARKILSWVVFVVSVIIAIPALIGVHIATTLGDLADDIDIG